MADLARRQRLNTPEELYAAIGYGGIQLSRLMISIKDECQAGPQGPPPADHHVPIHKQKATEGVIVEGLDNCPIKFAKCCNPLPGDDIDRLHHPRLWRVHPQKRLVFQRAGRPSGDDSARWVNAHWAEKA